MICNGESNKFNLISFFFFLCALTGFLSQGAVNYWTRNFLLPPQVIFVFLSFIFLSFSGQLRKDSYFPIIIGSCSFFYMIFHELPHLHSLPDLIRCFQLLVGMMIYVIVFNLSFYKKYFIFLIYILFLMVCLNSLVGIGELFLFDKVPWSCFYNKKINTAVGLEWFPVALGYALSAPISMAFLFVIVNDKIITPAFKIFSFITLSLGIIILFLSQSRSAFIGVIVSTVVCSFFYLDRKKYLIKLVSLCLFTCVVLIIPLKATYRKTDVIKDPRIINTYMTYLPIIVINPFANKQFSSEKDALNQFHQQFGIKIKEERIENALTISSPHNTFLSLGLRYGIIPFFLQMILYLYCFYCVYKILSKTDRLQNQYQIFAKASCAGILAFMFHAHFHNAGLFLGEMRNWIYVALLVCFYKQTQVRS